MVYTHDFEIKVDGILIEGEINFNHGENAAFKTTLGEEMTVVQHGKIQEFLQELVNFSNKFGEIEKIEIIKKVV